jgi:hypothetical protein
MPIIYCRMPGLSKPMCIALVSIDCTLKMVDVLS